MKQGWKSYLLYSSVILFIGVFAYILFETIKEKNTGFETKTLWDWMELLIIPAVLAGGAILLNRSERALERKIAEDRAKLEQDLAADRQQEEALQNYFDRMSELLLKEKLRTTKKVEVRDIARTRTLSIMRVLDTRRNNLVIQFLREAKLITDKKSILIGANMSTMNLQGTNFELINLAGADLQDAMLKGVIFWMADLQSAVLHGANLQGAYLTDANLQETYFTNTNLQGAHLHGANLKDAILVDANLQGAYLTNVNLVGANLRYANLKDANFEGANLEHANLHGAKNITEGQLEKAKSLKGMTMPDGTKHN